MPQPKTYRIQEFLNYLTFQKRYSNHTIISYENDLNGFLSFIWKEYETTELSEMSPSMVRTWLASLKENKIAPKTINRKISTLKSFFKYQLKLQKIDVSPVATISSLKVSRRLPSFIEQKDLDTLFHEKDKDINTNFEGIMNFLILELLYQTGIRLSELIHLKERNVDKSGGTIKVLGKGNKERIIPVSNQLLNHISNYVSAKKNEFPEDPGTFLFVSKKGNALYPKYVYKIVKENLAKVSTNKRKSPHILRHSFATHLTSNGAQINAIKELLGHSSLASTQVYTHNSIEKLKQAHKQAHPKS